MPEREIKPLKLPATLGPADLITKAAQLTAALSRLAIFVQDLGQVDQPSYSSKEYDFFKRYHRTHIRSLPLEQRGPALVEAAWRRKLVFETIIPGLEKQREQLPSLEDQAPPVETEEELQGIQELQKVINSFKLTEIERKILILGSVFSEQNLGYNQQWLANVYGVNLTDKQVLRLTFKKFLQGRQRALDKVADKIEMVTVWPEGQGMGKKAGHYLKLKELTSQSPQPQADLLKLEEDGARFKEDPPFFLNDLDLANLRYLSQHPDQAFSTTQLRALLPQKLNQVDLSDTIHYVERIIGRKYFPRIGRGRTIKYQWPSVQPEEITQEPSEPAVDRALLEKKLEEAYTRRQSIIAKIKKGDYDKNWLFEVEELIVNMELQGGKIPLKLSTTDPYFEENIHKLLDEIESINPKQWGIRDIFLAFNISRKVLEGMFKNKRRFTPEEVAYIRYRLKSNSSLTALEPILQVTIEAVSQKRRAQIV